MIGPVEQLGERTDANLLLERVESRRANRVDDLGLDGARRVGDAAVPLQELRAGHPLGKLLGVDLGRIEGGEVLVGAAQEPLAHERRATRPAVVGAGDGVVDPRIDPPHGERGGERNRARDLGRAAEEQQQVTPLPVRRRHLVHRAARGVGEQLLGVLADQGEPPRLRGAAQAGRGGLQHGHSDRGGRGETLALGDVGRDQHAQSPDRCPLLAQEEGDRAEDVGTPGRRSGEAGRELGERLFDQGGDVERHPAVVAHGDDHSVVPRLRGGKRGGLEGQLEHQGSGVVGDPAEHVETTRGAGDRDRHALGEEGAVEDRSAERTGAGELVDGRRRADLPDASQLLDLGHALVSSIPPYRATPTLPRLPGVRRRGGKYTRCVKAVVIERPHEAVFREVETPACGPGEVLVRSRLAGVCRTDLEVLNGELDRRWVRYPCIPGHEWSGLVEAVGEGVADLGPGDPVVSEGFCYCGACRRCRAGDTHLCEHYDCLGFTRGGGFGEFVLVPRRFVHRLPDCVALDEAVLVEPASVVLKGLLRAEPKAGETVGVVGVGTLGALAIVLTRLFTPAAVVAYGVREEELELARRLGAAEAIDLSGGPRRTRVSSTSSSRRPAPSPRWSSRRGSRARAAGSSRSGSRAPGGSWPSPPTGSCSGTSR